jgi:hypothetical protein
MRGPQGSITFKRASQTAALSYRVYPNATETTAAAIEVPAGPAVARFGLTVVHFSIVENELNPSASRSWRDKVLPRLRASAQPAPQPKRPAVPAPTRPGDFGY